MNHLQTGLWHKIRERYNLQSIYKQSYSVIQILILTYNPWAQNPKKQKHKKNISYNITKEYINKRQHKGRFRTIMVFLQSSHQIKLACIFIFFTWKADSHNLRPWLRVENNYHNFKMTVTTLLMSSTYSSLRKTPTSNFSKNGVLPNFATSQSLDMLAFFLYKSICNPIILLSHWKYLLLFETPTVHKGQVQNFEPISRVTIHSINLKYMHLIFGWMLELIEALWKSSIF